MTMGTLSEIVIQKKFETLQSTQENIETVSLWCLHHKDHHSLIVKIWMKCFKTVTLKQRLSLIYLLNDVCQRERHKKYDGFRKSFTTVLKEAFMIIRSDEIRSNVERMIDIWKERDIFEVGFVNELKQILQPTADSSNSNTPKEDSVKPVINEKWLAEFKSDVLISELERLKNEKQTVQRSQSILPPVPFHPEGVNVKSYLKDRQEGVKYAREIDFAHKKLSDFVDDLERHLQGQSRLIGQLEHAKVFYETQLTEAGIVESAYRKFGAGIQRVKQELDKMKATGLYPEEESPPVNAPSPGPNEDPFAQGVEAVAASSKHKPTDIEPIDMDLEEDTNLHSGTTSRALATLEGLKVATNRTFLPSQIASLTSGTQNGTVPLGEPSSKIPKLYDPSPQQQQGSGWPPTVHDYRHNMVNQNVTHLQQPPPTNVMIQQGQHHHRPPVNSVQQHHGGHPGLTFDYNHSSMTSSSSKSTMLPAVVPTMTSSSSSTNQIPPAPSVVVRNANNNVPSHNMQHPPPPPPMQIHHHQVAPHAQQDLLLKQQHIPYDVTSPPPLRFPQPPPAVAPPAGGLYGGTTAVPPPVPYGGNPQYSPPIVSNVVHVSRFGPSPVKEQRSADINDGSRDYPPTPIVHHVTRGGINQSNLTVLSGGGGGNDEEKPPDPRYRNVAPTGGAADGNAARTFWSPGSQQMGRFSRPPPPGSGYPERQRFQQHQQHQRSSWPQQGM